MRQRLLADPHAPQVHRVVVQAVHDELVAQATVIDRQLSELTARRHHLRAATLVLRDRLYPRFEQWHEARPAPEVTAPAVAATTTVVRGAALRMAAGEALRASGPLQVDELLATLAATGLTPPGPTPAKSLANALAHEASAGRVTRLGRGLYGP